MVTKDICEIHYSKQDILSVDEIKSNRDIGGNNPPLIYLTYFDLNIKILTSGGQVIDIIKWYKRNRGRGDSRNVQLSKEGNKTGTQTPNSTRLQLLSKNVSTASYYNQYILELRNLDIIDSSNEVHNHKIMTKFQ